MAAPVAETVEAPAAEIEEPEVEEPAAEVAEPAAEAEEPSPEPSPEPSAPASASPERSAARAAPTAAPEPTPEPAAAPAPAPTPREETPTRPQQPNEETQSALDDILPPTQPRRRAPEPEPAPAPAADLPDTPSRTDVRRVLGRLMGRLRTCAGDQEGLATAILMVRNDGSVSSATVSGATFSNTPQGQCMEQALSSARFPAFRQPTFQVRYPFSIRQL
jgi:hypothetical protein